MDIAPEQRLDFLRACVDLDDYVLDVSHGALIRWRGCLSSKVLHHAREAVKQCRVLVPNNLISGPKQEIKVVFSIVDREGLGEDLFVDKRQGWWGEVEDQGFVTTVIRSRDKGKPIDLVPGLRRQVQKAERLLYGLVS